MQRPSFFMGIVNVPLFTLARNCCIALHRLAELLLRKIQCDHSLVWGSVLRLFCAVCFDSFGRCCVSGD